MLAVFCGFIVVGLLLLVRILRERWTRPDDLAWVAILVGAFVVVQLAQAVASFASYFPNACDDLLAYIPMAQRLLDTGQIIEPWSIRRLQNLGGGSFLQSLFVYTAGPSGIGVPERLTACTFLAGLFVGGARRPSTRLACVVVVLLVPALAVPRLDSSAVLLVVPLMVAVFVAVGRVRTALVAQAPGEAYRWVAAAGLLLAAIASLRLQIVAFPTLVLVLGVVTVRTVGWRTRIVAVLVGGATACLGLLGWSVASWQSSGTPLYPLIGGNANPDVAMTGDPELSGLADQVGRTIELMLVGGRGPFVLAVVGVLVVTVAFRRRLQDPGLLYVVAAAALAVMVLVAAFLTLASTRDFTRYVFPIPAAVVVYLLLVVVRDDDRPERELAPEDTTASTHLWRLLPLGLAFVAFVYVFSPLSLVYPAEAVALRPGADGGLSADGHHQEVEDFIASQDERGQYRRAMEALRGRGRVIAAVDRPFLLDDDIADVPSLDLVGAAAPGGRFPVFGSTVAKVQLLRSQGFDYLLATEPDANDCSSPKLLQQIVDAQVRPGPLLASYGLAWVQSLDDIITDAPGAVRREGSLLLIDLHEAEAELAR